MTILTRLVYHNKVHLNISIYHQRFLSLCKSLKWLQFCSSRNYSNRNILKLHRRGLFEDVFPDPMPNLQSILSSKQCFYGGFDPTAESLHIGNLLVILALIHCQRSGHKVITLIGDGTAKVGDPSGRSTDRDPLSPEEINQNSESIAESLRRIFDNHEKYFWNDQKVESPLTPLIVLRNEDWYKNENIVQFLSLYGRQLRMGQMLSRKSVQSRINSDFGMSFCEFTYQLFQAYDWLHLYKIYGCKFQIGGADQMGNIHSGYELIHKETQDTVYGLTVPLIKSDSGDKLGKSAGNSIWLNENKTSCFDFYQYFIRLSDEDTYNLLPLFTFYSMANVKSMIDKQKLNPEKRYIQKKLAEELTLLVHGEDGLRIAKKATAVLYDKTPEAIADLSPNDFKKIFKGTAFNEILLEPGMTMLDVGMKIGSFSSEADAIRIINAGGFYVNHIRVTNPDAILVEGIHVLQNYISLIRVGKKNYYIIQWLR